MKYHLTDEQKYIQSAVKDFTKGEFDEDQILDLMTQKEFPGKLLKGASRLDFIGLTYPESAGGQGCGMMDNVLVIEELCRKDSGAGIALATLDLGAELIATYGDKNLHKACLTPLVKGKAISALVSPVLGDDKGAVTWEETSDGYRLNGECAYVLHAAMADFFIVEALPKGDGEKAIMVLKKDTRGIEVAPDGEKLGMDMLSWGTVAFRDVCVSGEAILHASESGVDLSAELQKIIMVKTGAMFLGIAQGAYDLAVSYAKQREQFRKKIGMFQGIRQKIAKMYITLQAARAYVYNATSLQDQGRIDLHDLIAAKLFAESAAEEITDESLQIHGGAGYMIEVPIEHFYRDVRCLRALTGRKTFQNDLVGDAVIGKI